MFVLAVAGIATAPIPSAAQARSVIPGAHDLDSTVATKGAPAVVRGGESAAAAYGRQIHRGWYYGPSFEKEFTLASGRRPDAINFATREIVELKPNNPAAISRGQRPARGLPA